MGGGAAPGVSPAICRGRPAGPPRLRSAGRSGTGASEGDALPPIPPTAPRHGGTKRQRRARGATVRGGGTGDGPARRRATVHGWRRRSGPPGARSEHAPQGARAAGAQGGTRSRRRPEGIRGARARRPARPTPGATRGRGWRGAALDDFQVRWAGWVAEPFLAAVVTVRAESPFYSVCLSWRRWACGWVRAGRCDEG